MTPGFGFSVGDFVSAIGLIRQVSRALKNTGGASAEYQNVIIELKALENVLRHLETLEPTEDNANHVNAIRGMALACQLPLRDFMVKIEKYERSLGPWSERTVFGSAGRKAQWAVSFAEEVEKIRALVAAKHISINLLLATHSSRDDQDLSHQRPLAHRLFNRQTLSKMNTRATKEHGDLMSKIALQRASLQHIQTQVEHLKDGLNDRAAVDRARLDAISSTIDATQASVLSLRSLGNQIIRHITKFPRDIRDLLRKILRSNWQIYRVLLLLEANITPNPTMLLGSNIKFEDALGVYTELPYEFFRHWELFEGFLRTQFKDKPGEDKIFKGLFHIIDVKNEGAIVKKEHWHRSISPGAMLTMSMIMSYLRRQAGSCPRPDCIGVGVSQGGELDVLVCGTCGLKYYPFSADSEDDLSHSDIAEDALILKKQAEEDLQLYGSRPEPPESVEIDEATQLAELQLPPLRSAAEFNSVVGRPANVRKKRESKACDSQTVTAVDWNSGVSPLDAWLNQIAVPLEFGKPESHNQRQEPSETDLFAQEVREINVFRNVHVDMTAPDNRSETSLLSDLLSLLPGAQIYYRNIRDRYPSLPTYLRRRLASANFSLAERLLLAVAERDSRDRRTADIKDVAQDVGKEQLVDRTKPLYNRPLGLKQSANEDSLQPNSHQGIKRAAPSTLDAEPLPSVFSSSSWETLSDSHHRSKTQISLDSGESWHWESDKPREQNKTLSLADLNTSAPVLPNQKPPRRRPSIGNTGSEPHSSHPRRSSAPAFWTGEKPGPRRRSSMNGLLRGHSAFEPEEQDPIFPRTRSRASSGGFTSASRGLPPPPVELSKHEKLSFKCDICGRTVRVERRLDWQEHVFADLRPYVCSFKDCDLADEQYLSKGEWLAHEFRNHIIERQEEQLIAFNKPDQPSGLLLCPFCDEKTDRGTRARGDHLGRHMEEIAFAVVTKPYEDWDFYSTSSLRSEHATDAHQAVGGRVSGINRDDLAGYLNGRIKETTIGVVFNNGPRADCGSPATSPPKVMLPGPKKPALAGPRSIIKNHTDSISIGEAKARPQSLDHEREALRKRREAFQRLKDVSETAQHDNGPHAAPHDAFKRAQERETRRSSAPQDRGNGQHEKIQDYYGCTFPSCNLHFGTALAWMNHELSTHLPLSAWRCSEHSTRDRSSSTIKCGQLFREKALFRWHLIYFHGIPKVGSCDAPYIAQQLRDRRVGRAGQERFWCGFCKEILPSPSTDLLTEDWKKRFDHINDEHFNKGKVPHDWCPMTPDNPYGYLELESGQGRTVVEALCIC